MKKTNFKMVADTLRLLANLVPRATLTKKAEDSGYEIGYSLGTNENKPFFFSKHTRQNFGLAPVLELDILNKDLLHYSDSILKSPVL